MRTACLYYFAFSAVSDIDVVAFSFWSCTSVYYIEFEEIDEAATNGSVEKSITLKMLQGIVVGLVVNAYQSASMS